MKKKKLNKKLSLNKVTIENLSRKEASIIKGGDELDPGNVKKTHGCWPSIVSCQICP